MSRWGSRQASQITSMRLDAKARAPLVLFLLALLGAGCESMPAADLGLSKYLKGAQPEVESAVAVSLGEWQRDQLHCAVDLCDNFYWIDVTRTGELSVDVYAPWGSGLPDFGVVLLDQNETPLAAPKDPTARPARLSSRVSPGRYTVRVHAVGADDGRISYELIASFEPSSRQPKQVKQPAPQVSPPPRPKRTAAPKVSTPVDAPTQKPAPPAPRPPMGKPLLSAEVLDVEQEDGNPAYVLLDAGEPQNLRVGMRGRLHESGRTIGEIEVVEVYRDGSRARLIGGLDGEITIDTAAEIFDSQ